MTNTNDTASRSKIANRFWIDDAGLEVSEEQATGVSYQFLGRKKDGVTVAGDQNPVKVYFRDLTPEATKMLAGFGTLTLLGNVTNTFLGDKSGEYGSAFDAMMARIALLNSGQWIDRTREGGVRVDKDVLAQAVVNIYLLKGVIDQDAMESRKASILEKFEADSEAIKTARSNTDILNEYTKLMGKASLSVEDVFGSL